MISKRIRTIASMIDNDKKVIDIGCDHAFLAISLRKNGHTGEILCTDLRRGPVEKAKENLALYGYDDIEVIQTPGVQGITFEADVAVMAGMGYKTVSQILDDDRDYFYNCEKIIIQVNHSNDHLRRWLFANDFKITDEIMIRDYKKYYEILTVENGKQDLTEDEILYGPVLLKKRSPEFIAFYEEKRDRLDQVMSELGPEHPDYDKLSQKKEALSSILEASPNS